MILKKFYYYYFYTIYSVLLKISVVPVRAKFSAVTFMITMELFIVFSLLNYRDFYYASRKIESLSSLDMLVPLLIILFTKWFFFSRNDDWEKYVTHYNNWPNNKNLKWGLITLVITIITIGNFIISNNLFFNIKH